MPEHDAESSSAGSPPGLAVGQAEVADGRVSFSELTARSSVDTMLRTTQQQLVALSGQADLKASLLTTASAVAASIAASQIGDRDIGWAAATLLVFLVVALLASVLAVFPKFEVHREPDGELPAHFNPLFFGHYARIPKEQYLKEMARVVASDDALYRTIVSDLYDQGGYLVNAKYRYLRGAYSMFLLGFVAAGIALAVTAAAR